MTRQQPERLNALHPIPKEAAKSPSFWAMILICSLLAVAGCLIAGGFIPDVAL